MAISGNKPRKPLTFKQKTAQAVIVVLKNRRRHDVLRQELLASNRRLVEANQTLKLWQLLEKQGVLHPASGKGRHPVEIALKKKEEASLAHAAAVRARLTELAQNKDFVGSLESKLGTALLRWAHKNIPQSKKAKRLQIKKGRISPPKN